MFGTARSGANTYATVGMETGVVAANPHKLIVMLFDGAKAAVTNAMQQMNLCGFAATTPVFMPTVA